MNFDGTRWIRSFMNLAIPIAFMAGMLFFTAVPRAHAESEQQCQRRVARADQLLHIAIEKNGPNSADADRRRHQLHEARERCWNEHHRRWDEDQHRWHEEHDWDDHDHDRH